MARTKDRYLKVLRHPYEPVVLLRKYRAAGYLRLSEDSERKQSDSIENQRYMINQYAKEHEDIEYHRERCITIWQRAYTSRRLH